MMQHIISRNIFISTLLTGIFAACLAAPAQAEVIAQVDRNKVYAGDPLTLIIESDGQQSGQPDLSVLNKDFTVLGNSTSTQIRIINGRRSDKISWIIQLEPRNKGKLKIPPITVGNEQTQALELEVTDVPEQVKAQQAEHVFLEVEADTQGHTLYVQQQIAYTVKLYYDDQILDGELDAPRPEHAVVEQLGKDKRYKVTRNNQLYNVIERHYAISPEKSGPLRIPPVSFKGQIATPRNSSARRSQQEQYIDHMFRNSPFANDPFFSSTPFAKRGHPVRINSEMISVDIQSRPATAGNTWLPAEHVTLHDSWSDNPPQFRVGEPVTRTITLQAKGLTGAQIPHLQLKQAEQTRQYPESPVNESRTDGNKVYGISKQNITYIPGKAGKLVIPEVNLSWWNTRTNEASLAQLPKWEIEVEPGIGGVQSQSAPALEKPKPTPDITKPESITPTQTINWLEQFKSFNSWLIFTGVLLLLIITFFVIKRWRYTKMSTPVLKQQPAIIQTTRAKIKNFMPELDRACVNGDAKTAANVLLEMARAQWPNDPPGNLGALATRLGAEHGETQIIALDRALYAADSSNWDGNDLWLTVKDSWPKSTVKKSAKEDSLPPLYPQSI